MPEDTEGKQLAQRLCSEVAEYGIIETSDLIRSLEREMERVIACLWEAMSMEDDRGARGAKRALGTLAEGLEHLRSLVSGDDAEHEEPWKENTAFPDEHFDGDPFEDRPHLLDTDVDTHGF